ncbi:cysteine-rich receptor-like protein kinase 10 isoform X2 [Citrus sinensis]|uniref:cysteine-rich receptor-like protein kinase 10 isoform X2 n=1 Tax=Citrus sinensis TaxID=2711 RepID=UPI002278DFC0|nr:cysteine-rich receptor-like protein kinase 10 isoform X2 [Citrus sinensis]
MLRHLSHILRHPILDDQNHQHHHNHNLSVDEMNLKHFISNLFSCLKTSLRGGRAAGEAAEDADGSGADSWNLFFDLRTLQVATNFFSDLNQLGHGGFGPVYRGLMPNGQEIAVKKLSVDSRQGLREFTNEVKLLLKIQHKNLVTLFGCCAEGPEKMLVYEYLPNKSLDYFIFDKTKSSSLDWTTRYRIVMGVARGLLYLHEEAPARIIHRDIKASNILLDEQLNPKISDFGLARLFPGEDTHVNTFRISGTHGYMAPEYALHGYLSVKTDVFSYGVLVLEIVSGRKNHDGRLGKEKADLLSYSKLNEYMYSPLIHDDNLWRPRSFCEFVLCLVCFSYPFKLSSTHLSPML